MITAERDKSGARTLEIETRGVLITVWRTVQAGGFGPRWIADAVDLRTGRDIGRYSHHATRERAMRSANRLLSMARRGSVGGAL